MKNEEQNIEKQEGNGVLPCVSNSTVSFDRFEQWIDWRTNSHGYSKCRYYMLIIYNGIVYKESESIITDSRTLEDVKSQILAARRKMLLKLFELISDNIPIPNIKEERM
jgi:hypothetical protein